MRSARTRLGDPVRVRSFEPDLMRLRLRVSAADRSLTAQIRRAVRENLAREDVDPDVPDVFDAELRWR